MNALHDLLERAADAWLATVLTRGLDALLLLAAVGLVLRVLRGRGSPHVRAFLPWVALLPLTVPVELPWPAHLRLPDWRFALRGAFETAETPAAPGRVRDATAASRSVVMPAPEGDTAALAPVRGASTLGPQQAPAAASRAPSWRAALFAAWLAVVTVALLRWIGRARELRRVLRAAAVVPARELPPRTRAALRGPRGRGVELRESELVPAPLACGVVRPCIALPAGLRARLSDGELRFVVLHELAHVRRGDLRASLLLRLVRIAWCFHPAPWLAGRWWMRARELACDDAALARFEAGERPACARALLEVVQAARGAAGGPAGAAAFAAEVDDVRSRVMSMIEPRRAVRAGLSRGAFAACTLVAVAIVAAVGAPQDGPARAAPPARDEARPATSGDAPGDTRLAAIVAAADWLVRHQEHDGFWDADGFGRRCRECDQKGQALNDVGVTGLALLALLAADEAEDGAGGAGERRAAMVRAGRFLESVQDEDGCIGAKSGQHFMYGQMLATAALAGLQERHPSRQRAGPLQRAVDFIESARNPYRGWRYAFPPDGDNDTSVTSLALLALQKAAENGASVEAQALRDGYRWLDEMRDPATGRVGYHEPGSRSAREPDDMDLWPVEHGEAMTAAALHARSAESRSIAARPDVRQGVALLAAKPPRWDAAEGTIDCYYWWHGSEAMKALGSEHAPAWNNAAAAALLAHQRTDGHAAGSFDATPDPWGDNGGRIYSTAINLLTLAAAR